MVAAAEASSLSVGLMIMADERRRCVVHSDPLVDFIAYAPLQIALELLHHRVRRFAVALPSQFVPDFVVRDVDRVLGLRGLFANTRERGHFV